MPRDYPDIGLHVPELLLPAPGVAPETWAVVACDQHTSEPAYWRETERIVAGAPSSLDLVLPEAFLDDTREARVAAIHRRMQRHLADGVLRPHGPGFVLVERDVGRAAPRRGLVLALDLDCFDYRPGAQGLVRSTEGTDPARLPTRIAVRRGAPLEVPHILVLIDDPRHTVIEPLSERQGDLAPLYDFELMQGGGRLKGWLVDAARDIDAVAQALRALRRGEPPLLYAMGDGNHSFAAARAVWEEVRASAPSDSPGRHALVELVNIHDEALEFAPIHRLVEGVEPETVLQAMASHFQAHGFERRAFAERETWRHALAEAQAGPGHAIGCVVAGALGLVRIARPAARLAAATLQSFLDEALGAAQAARVDYIHGDATLEGLAQNPGRVGFLLPAMDKRDLFRTVIEDGAAPRKSFSLGEAHEKRYYMECRRIRS